MKAINIKVKEVRYRGYLRGHKVYIRGRKYPREWGHWYTELDRDKASSNGFHEWVEEQSHTG